MRKKYRTFTKYVSMVTQREVLFICPIKGNFLLKLEEYIYEI